MKRIPEGLTFADLTTDQREVFLCLHDRAVAALDRRSYQRHKPLVATFMPLSDGQRVECELFELGLIARVQSNPKLHGVTYGYAMSVFGSEWYECQQQETRP